ncbi:rRNA biogenesis protein rrp36 [Erysiphe neolycopersici]|uniref:rRNA biogenesis protein RRP36 n=1 Tax=Erysiphe neolycopersici TaxID=212602 RepID=A0A420HPN6_9PEZI|nr:rRNA biogenesis protein rrp36 [Erysiphe neolycopersici]
MSQKRSIFVEENRRVKFRRELSEDNISLPSSQLRSIDSESDVEDGSFSNSEAIEDEDEDEEEDTLSIQAKAAASISFGALAKAQSKFSQSKSSRQKDTSQIDSSWKKDIEKLKNQSLGTKTHREFHRSNNHAPTEITSKKAVTRKREVVPVKNRQARDPRFEPLGASLQAITLTKAYSFLDDYRETEMKDLKAALKKTKNVEEKEKLKRTLLVMESKKKAKLRKLKEQEIIDRHRKQEKALVKQGKKPFYLKKSEQKKQVLLDQFNELKGKKLDRVIERRRKKIEGKQKKKMPLVRRSQE